jgi:aryl-alcohol dehydrogenase-like predicted oxidoreductase
MSAVEASLRRLKTDWIDLYQQHVPDPMTPMEETLRALDDLTRQGKVRYIGCSNLPAWQVADAVWNSRSHDLSTFASAQDEYSLLARGAERELLPALSAYGWACSRLPPGGRLLTGSTSAANRFRQIAADLRQDLRGPLPDRA